MNFVQKLFIKLKKKEKKDVAVITTRDLTKHMQETRTMLVSKYDDKKMKDQDISMFH